MSQNLFIVSDLPQGSLGEGIRQQEIGHDLPQSITTIVPTFPQHEATIAASTRNTVATTVDTSANDSGEVIDSCTPPLHTCSTPGFCRLTWIWPSCTRSYSSYNVICSKELVDHFRDACLVADLPIKWGDRQIEAHLQHIDALYFTAKTLKTHWAFVNNMCKIFDHQLSAKHITLFDTILAHCKTIKDDELPVSLPLLLELCQAADKLFTEYDALLAKSLFLQLGGISPHL